MKNRLYLGLEDSLRLKKAVVRLEDYLSLGGRRPMPIVALNHLRTLAAALAPASKTKREINELVRIFNSPELSADEKHKSAELLNILRQDYRLDKIKFTLKSSAAV